MGASRSVTVSAVLIVKDEEAVLADCLASLTWADEVVVYDTGSTDGTLALARAAGVRVVEGTWDDDFGAARNRALAHATGDWVLSIDADEVFEGDPVSLRKRLLTGTPVRSVLQVGLEGGGRTPTALSVNRLHRRDAAVWAGELHEQLVPAPGVAAVASAPLPGVVLRHSGYEAERFVAKEKGRRNVEIARKELAAAEAAGLPAGEVAVRAANLARSLGVSGRHVEALELAEPLAQSGDLTERSMVTLAMAMAAVAEAVHATEARDAWLARWEAYGSNPAQVWAVRARLAAEADDPAAALDALGHVPTTSVDGDGVRLERRSLAPVEIWALSRTGRHRQARVAALDAVRHGRTPGNPLVLLAELGEAVFREVVAELPADQWPSFVLPCALVPGTEALRVLEVMVAVRPDSGAALGAAARLHTHMGLEDAVQWSTRLRAAGLTDACTLVHLAQDEAREPRERALAAALAYDVWKDVRGADALEDVLELVPARDEDALLAELDVVAPGLVGRAA